MLGKVWLGNGNAIFEEFRRIGIVEVRTHGRRSDILYGRRVDGSEVKIRFRKVPIYNKRGVVIDVRLVWEVIQ